MRNYILLNFFLIFHVASIANENPKFKKAEKLYASFSYKEAIVLYEELEKQNIDKQKVTERLANCYRLINDMKNAEKWYALHVANNKYSADDVYYYAMALRENGKDAEADEWMEKFRQLRADDSRGKEFADSKKLMEKLMKKSSNYKIANLDFNTDGIEFSPIFFEKGQLAFVAARSQELIIKREFAWNQTPFLDVYLVKQNNNGSFTKPQPLKGKVNSKYHDGPGCLSPNGSVFYFTRNNFYKGKKQTSKDGILKLELYAASKSSNGHWGHIEKLNFDNKEYSFGHPAISADGNRLYFASDMPGSIGGTDIWYSDRKNDGTWGSPINLGPKVNTEGNEMFPFVTKTGDLFFASNGHFGLGGLDIFYSPNKGGQYNKVVNLGYGINTINDDFGLIVDAENKYGYFSSNREGGKGDDDIYSVEFLKPLKESSVVKIQVFDDADKKPLPNASVKAYINGVEQIIKLNENGEAEFEAEPGNKLEFEASAEKYFAQNKKEFTNTLSEDVTVMDVKIYLVKDEGYSLAFLIKDSKSNEPLSDVKLSFSGWADIANLTTNSEGKCISLLKDKKPGDVLNFKVKIEKDGYLSKEVPVNYKLEKPGVVWLNDLLNVSLDKLEVGMDIGKLIDIKPIYFDLGKFNIRKDAAIELDKIVRVMNEHPKMVIELGSHTDCRGTAKSNEILSDKRAKASAAYVVSKGISSERIYGKGYGESKLVNGCACEGTVKSTCSEAEHQQNRRTEFVIVKMD